MICDMHQKFHSENNYAAIGIYIKISDNSNTYPNKYWSM